MEFIEKDHSGVMVALYPPRSIRKAVAHEGGESVDDLHTTLAYLPGIGADEDAYAAVCKAMESVAGDFAQPQGWIGGTGRFNGSEASGGKDVYYASVNSPGMPALHHEVMKELDAHGLEPSRRHGFSPHMTLKYLDPEDAMPGERKASEPFTVPHLSVVSKTLGARHIPFTGERALKGLPTSSDVHVPAPGAEEEEPKKPEEQDTTHSDLVIPPPVDNLETDILKAALGLEEEEFQETDPATADDAWPMELAEAALEEPTEKRVLTTEGRKRLQASDFALPGRRYPIENLAHARNALARASGKTEEGKVRAAVYRKYPELKDRAEKIAQAIDGQVFAIRKADAKKQVVYCVVTEPHTVDSQDDWMTPEDIEDTAHAYMLESRIIGKNHRAVIKAAPVESYIAPQDLDWSGGPYGPQTVRKGSWVVGIKVFDPAEWKKVEAGDYQGVSISGWGHRSAA